MVVRELAPEFWGRVSGPLAALSGSSSKAPGFAGGYLPKHLNRRSCCSALAASRRRRMQRKYFRRPRINSPWGSGGGQGIDDPCCQGRWGHALAAAFCHRACCAKSTPMREFWPATARVDCAAKGCRGLRLCQTRGDLQVRRPDPGRWHAPGRQR